MTTVKLGEEFDEWQVWDQAPEPGTYWATDGQPTDANCARIDSHGNVIELLDMQDIVKRANAFASDPRVRVQQVYRWPGYDFTVYHHTTACDCPRRRKWRIERHPWLVDVVTRRIPPRGNRRTSQQNPWKVAPCLFGHTL